MYKHIDADYYGFRDEEDGVLLPAEAAAEKALQAEVGKAAWPHAFHTTDRS
jgi:pre-mRNA-splicing factor ISY1